MTEKQAMLLEKYNNYVNSIASRKNLSSCVIYTNNLEYCVDIPEIGLSYRIEIDYLLLNLKMDFNTEKSVILNYINAYYRRNFKYNK